MIQSVSFVSWDRYEQWLKHIKAATALLDTRGKAQFDRIRGVQLFIQLRSHVVSHGSVGPETDWLLMISIASCLFTAASRRPTSGSQGQLLFRSWRCKGADASPQDSKPRLNQ